MRLLSWIFILSIFPWVTLFAGNRAAGAIQSHINSPYSRQHFRYRIPLLKIAENTSNSLALFSVTDPQRGRIILPQHASGFLKPRSFDEKLYIQWHNISGEQHPTFYDRNKFNIALVELGKKHTPIDESVDVWLQAEPEQRLDLENQLRKAIRDAKPGADLNVVAEEALRRVQGIQFAAAVRIEQIGEGQGDQAYVALSKSLKAVPFDELKSLMAMAPHQLESIDASSNPFLKSLRASNVPLKTGGLQKGYTDSLRIGMDLGDTALMAKVIHSDTPDYEQTLKNLPTLNDLENLRQRLKQHNEEQKDLKIELVEQVPIRGSSYGELRLDNGKSILVYFERLAQGIPLAQLHRQNKTINLNNLFETVYTIVKEFRNIDHSSTHEIRTYKDQFARLGLDGKIQNLQNFIEKKGSNVDQKKTRATLIELHNFLINRIAGVRSKNFSPIYVLDANLGNFIWDESQNKMTAIDLIDNKFEHPALLAHSLIQAEVDANNTVELQKSLDVFKDRFKTHLKELTNQPDYNITEADLLVAICGALRLSSSNSKPFFQHGRNFEDIDREKSTTRQKLIAQYLRLLKADFDKRAIANGSIDSLIRSLENDQQVLIALLLN